MTDLQVSYMCKDCWGWGGGGLCTQSLHCFLFCFVFSHGDESRRQKQVLWCFGQPPAITTSLNIAPFKLFCVKSKATLCMLQKKWGTSVCVRCALCMCNYEMVIIMSQGHTCLQYTEATHNLSSHTSRWDEYDHYLLLKFIGWICICKQAEKSAEGCHAALLPVIICQMEATFPVAQRDS